MDGKDNNKQINDKKKEAQQFLSGEHDVQKKQASKLTLESPSPLVPAPITTKEKTSAIFALEGEERNIKREAEKQKKEETERAQKAKEEAEKKRIEDTQKAKEAKEKKKLEHEKLLASNKKLRDEERANRLLQEASDRENKATALVEEIQGQRTGKPIDPYKKKDGAPAPKPKPLISSLRTLTGDSARAIKNRKESLTKLKLAAEKKEKEAPAQENQSAKKPILLIVIVFVLFIVAVGVGILALQKTETSILGFSFQKESEEIIIVDLPLVGALIRPHAETHINIEDPLENILQTISNATENNALGKITNIYFTEPKTTATEDGIVLSREAIGAQDFLNIWQNSAPDQLKRSLRNEFMIGVHTFNTGTTSPFMIFTINSYENAFAGMLAWERNLQSDYNALFGGEFSNNENSPLFRDIFISQQDARALSDSIGSPVLLYVFIDNFLIITNSREALEKIQRRMDE